MFKKAIKYIFKKDDFSSLNYWEKRYNRGGNSGDGSYGRLSKFKADFINDFIEKNKVHSSTEIGCGDGHQVSLINYQVYLGLDVSQTIIDACKIKFNEDLTKNFEVYNPDSFIENDFPKADLALSLDVIYHIVEGNIYKKHLEDLFSLSKKFVLIYSTNFNLTETDHVLHRKFTDDIEHFIDWQLVDEVKNPYPGNGEQESNANFYIFKKQSN
jgi:hypothetical protein